ncbi:unnamed protein product [Blepharisma stoltei]|uniref:F-box/kelch-repeat protein n=1 Tax=Blepharisma stoltei TaxID=1481888 RepID=A0AAU9JK01_9CILI|nr:unnamed protein product [Blepharisma stoltei]
MTCIIPDTQLFIYGGYIKEYRARKDAIMIDLVSMESKILKSGKKRAGGGLAQFGGQIYIFGGIKNLKWNHIECDKYDIRTNTWISIASLPCGSGAVCAEVFGNDILVAGFWLDALYSYSIGKNTYSRLFGLITEERKMLIVSEGRVWIMCNNFGFFESQQYGLSRWNRICGVTNLGLYMTQYVKFENKLYFEDGYMNVYSFDLSTRKFRILQ